MAQDVEQSPRRSQHEDVMPLMGIDHVEFYVGNARQAAYYYSLAFGFGVTAYAGPETKVRDRASYLLEQGDARFVVTGAMGPESPIAQHVREHGDGVRDVAFRVPDASYAFDYATKQGAKPVEKKNAFGQLPAKAKLKIDPADLGLLTMTDSPQEACAVVLNTYMSGDWRVPGMPERAYP